MFLIDIVILYFRLLYYLAKMVCWLCAGIIAIVIVVVIAIGYGFYYLIKWIWNRPCFKRPYCPLPPKSMRASAKKMTPMRWNPCANGPYYFFLQYYISQSYDVEIYPSQGEFREQILQFKEGGNKALWYYFVYAIGTLQVADPLIIYMPCSSHERYYKRWRGLDNYLKNFGLRTGLDKIRIFEEREQIHRSEPGERRQASVNFELNIPLGSVCVILDDVRTTGSSCATLQRIIQENGSHVIGAVVLAQVPRYDDDFECSLCI